MNLKPPFIPKPSSITVAHLRDMLCTDTYLIAHHVTDKIPYNMLLLRYLQLTYLIWFLSHRVVWEQRYWHTQKRFIRFVLNLFFTNSLYCFTALWYCVTNALEYWKVLKFKEALIRLWLVITLLIMNLMNSFLKNIVR